LLRISLDPDVATGFGLNVMTTGEHRSTPSYSKKAKVSSPKSIKEKLQLLKKKHLQMLKYSLKLNIIEKKIRLGIVSHKYGID